MIILVLMQAAAGRMLYDTAGMDKGGVEEGGSAAMLEGTQLCRTCQLKDILHCLGGVTILMPLLSQLGRLYQLHTGLDNSTHAEQLWTVCCSLSRLP